MSYVQEVILNLSFPYLRNATIVLDRLLDLIFYPTGISRSTVYGIKYRDWTGKNDACAKDVEAAPQKPKKSIAILY